MKKILVFISLMFMCFSAPAYAETTVEYEQKVRGWIVEKDAVINGSKKYRDNACAKLHDPAKSDCVGKWQTILDRREDEKTTMELWIVALYQEPKIKNFVLFKLVPAAKLQATSEETSKMATALMKEYPKPKTVLQK